jgi:hypothetical protein
MFTFFERDTHLRAVKWLKLFGRDTDLGQLNLSKVFGTLADLGEVNLFKKLRLSTFHTRTFTHAVATCTLSSLAKFLTHNNTVNT